jgi:hypothetical protein
MMCYFSKHSNAGFEQVWTTLTLGIGFNEYVCKRIQYHLS